MSNWLHNQLWVWLPITHPKASFLQAWLTGMSSRPPVISRDWWHFWAFFSSSLRSESERLSCRLQLFLLKSKLLIWVCNSDKNHIFVLILFSNRPRRSPFYRNANRSADQHGDGFCAVVYLLHQQLVLRIDRNNYKTNHIGLFQDWLRRQQFVVHLRRRSQPVCGPIARIHFRENQLEDIGCV